MMALLSQHFLIVLAGLANALIVILILQQKRTPQSALAWILFAFLLPYLALPLWFVLGIRKRNRKITPLAFDETVDDDPDLHPLARTFARLGGPPASHGNGLTLHETGEEAREALHETIDGARRSIDALFYIVDDDEAGREFVRRLTARVHDGVSVRLILDRLGTLTRPRAELENFTAAGGHLKFVSPFLWGGDNSHLNLRNHRKMVIADGEVTWAGGRNIGQQYLTGDETSWTDLSFTATGPVVHRFCEVFASDGDAPVIEEPADHWTGPANLQLLAAGPDESRDVLHDGLVNAIHAAQDRVWISTPYFVPTEHLAQALNTAARRGVDVRVIVPRRSNKRMTDFARGAYLRDIQRAGGHVLCYDGMLHAKAGMIDDAGWVGSANFDVRSMLLNFELALFAYDEDTVETLAKWFASVEARTTEGVPQVGPFRRTVEGLFRLSAPML
ncbi:hypothetical protein ATO6_12085 [Oceanicola sp. 22II-s10i]|uniref:phospholipase D-like domain-containing protein n=1 Tax=Oceanicola sp. 22II-s10i TaxID=1317116 RepID=UPI000B644401|nr:phospholipase D-like domain-containing protein [Oceanicola sp. 22II-s10i]OWU84439.1 hypothetical protein ATO6_12085 [Oceanicola sp. 22II-s10i]